MPIPCFQMHVIHFWYCQVSGSQIFLHLMHLQEICSHCTMLFHWYFQLTNGVFLLSELKSWWMTATQGSLSTGDYASYVRRVTPVKGQLLWIPDRILPENAWRSGGVSQCTWWAICCNSKTSQRMHQRNAGWQRSNMASKLLFSCHNQTELQRARDRFEQSVATGQYAMFDKSAAFYASWITGKLSSELEL